MKGAKNVPVSSYILRTVISIILLYSYHKYGVIVFSIFCSVYSRVLHRSIAGQQREELQCDTRSTHAYPTISTRFAREQQVPRYCDTTVGIDNRHRPSVAAKRAGRCRMIVTTAANCLAASPVAVLMWLYAAVFSASGKARRTRTSKRERDREREKERARERQPE